MKVSKKSLSFILAGIMLFFVSFFGLFNITVNAYQCYYCSGKGQVTRIEYVDVVCSTCSGKGTVSKKDTSRLRCMDCGSSNVNVEFVPTGFGGYGEKRQCLSCRSYNVSIGYVETSTCNSCWGSGKKSQLTNKVTRCSYCKGTGKIKTQRPKAPKPTLKVQEENFVELVYNSEMEYSIDNINWQNTSSFYNLSANTSYSFYQRYKSNADYYTGESSEPLVVVLHKHSYSNSCDKTCNGCDAKRTTEHKYTDACDKTCNVCKSTRETTHTFDSGKITKKATCKSTGVKIFTCNICKKTKTSIITKTKKHTYTNSCDKICNVCKVKRSIKHTYSNACDKTCNVCKAKRTTKHKYSNVCDKKCNICNATRNVKHKYSNSCDTTCNICKSKRTISHTYSNSKDKTCNVCKKVRCIHKYKTKTVKATTEKNGYVLTECSFCGKDKLKTIIYSAKIIKLSKSAYTYDGKVKTPSVVVKNSKGKTISKKYYSVSYQSGRNKAGKYKVTVKFKGRYSGTKILCFKINALTDEEKFEKYCTYKISKGRVIIESVNESVEGSLVIPSKIKGYPVEEIGFNAFNNAYQLTSVTIPASIEKIYDYSFVGCNSLVNINVSAKNKYYSSLNGVLYNKDKTEIIRYPVGKTADEFVIPSTITTIANNSFTDSYLENITIPNSVKKIGDSAFFSSIFLKKITIPNGVTEICDNAFSGCTSITSISIPATVSKMWNNPLAFCTSLKNISVSSANQYYTSVDGVLFNKDKTELICYPAGKTDKKYTVPNGVKTIISNAFIHSNSFTEKSLTSIVIPKSVTCIDFCAFSHCNSLKNVYYKGSKSQKLKIYIDEAGNDYLLSAKWHYNA